MAYITKEQIQEKRKQINALCKLHGVTATVSGANTSSVTVTIRKGKIDFLGNHVDTVKFYWITNDQQDVDNAEYNKKKGHMQCNPYYLDQQFSGDSLVFLEQLLAILKIGHYDNSNAMIDYFDTAYYIHICIGEWNKPYLLTSE